ncbi:MAG: DUF6468 domain-containing protein [Bauldia sp.]
MTLGLVIEILVAVLLGVTLFYCAVLNKRLVALRGDEAAFKATIGELRTTIEAADRAIKGLKATAAEAEETLGGKLKRAAELNQEIVRRTGEGRALMERLAQVTLAGRPARPPQSEGEAAAETIGSAAARAARRISEIRRARRNEEAA